MQDVEGHDRVRVQSVAAAVAMIVVVCGSGLLGGCQKALFPANEPRSQFQSYDRMRNRYSPLEVSDVFGNPRPALRSRLSGL